MDDAAIREALISQFRSGRDLDRTHEIYHDDAVLEFPQSGERFVGKATFLAFRKRYPANVTYRVRRITGHGSLWILELLVSYDGGPPMYGMSFHEFRGDKIAREVIYVGEGFDPSAARMEWATRFDPLTSVAADDWVEGAPFGIDQAPTATPAPAAG